MNTNHNFNRKFKHLSFMYCGRCRTSPKDLDSCGLIMLGNAATRKAMRRCDGRFDKDD